MWAIRTTQAGLTSNAAEVEELTAQVAEQTLSPRRYGYAVVPERATSNLSPFGVPRPVQASHPTVA